MMTVRKHCTRLVAVLACLAAMMVSTSPLAAAKSKKQVTPCADSVTIASLSASAPFAAEYAAFGTTGAMKAVEKKYNTTINRTEFGLAQDATNAMLGGSADMSISGLTSYLTVEAAGKDVKAVFAPFYGGGGVLLGAKKYEKDRGTDLSKYDGSTFGYTRAGSVSQLLTQVAAERAGLTWADTPQVAFGQPAAGIGVLQAGRADAIATDPTSASQAINAGTAYLLLNFNDPKTSYPVIGQQLGTVYGVNNSFAQKCPELTKAIVGALGKGLAAVKKVGDKPNKVLKLFPADIQAKLTDGWAGAWALSAPGVLASDGTMPDRAINDTLTFYLNEKLLTPKQAATVTKVVDNSFVTGEKTTTTTAP
jgi:ABC-type nitrate/sulfonate/bicarbonate transport system substrate-binding protein